MVSKSTRSGGLLDLLFTNREALVGCLVVRGCLGHRNREILEFSVLGEVRKGLGLLEGGL